MLRFSDCYPFKISCPALALHTNTDSVVIARGSLWFSLVRRSLNAFKFQYIVDGRRAHILQLQIADSI